LKGLKETTWADIAALSIAIAVFSILPLASGSSYLLMLALLSYLFGVLVAIYDLFYIRTGYINLGYTFMIALCGYAFAIATRSLPHPISIPAFLALSLALCSAMLVPMMKLRGPYYSVATLLYPFSIPPIARLFPEVFGGDAGLYVSAMIGGTYTLYYSTIALGILVLASLIAIANSRLGIHFTMIRDDEVLAESSGVRILRLKVLAHMIATAMVASVMAFYAQVSTVVSVELSDPIPILIYALMASAIYRPGSAIYSFLGGVGLWWLDSYMRSYIYDVRLIVAASLLLSIYLSRGVVLNARVKIR